MNNDVRHMFPISECSIILAALLLSLFSACSSTPTVNLKDADGLDADGYEEADAGADLGADPGGDPGKDAAGDTAGDPGTDAGDDAGEDARICSFSTI